MLKIALPSEPHWYTIFNAKTVDVEAIAMTLLRLYSKQPRPYCEVTAEVDVLREGLEIFGIFLDLIGIFFS